MLFLTNLFPSVPCAFAIMQKNAPSKAILRQKLRKLKRTAPSETLRKEVVSLGFYHYKTIDTLHKDCESVIVGYIL